VGGDGPAEYITLEMEDLFHRDRMRILLGAPGGHRSKVLPVSGSAGCGKSTFLRYYFSFYRPNYTDAKYICLRLDLSERSSVGNLIEDALQQIGLQVSEMLLNEPPRVDTMSRKELEAYICELLSRWQRENAGLVCETFLWIDNVDTAIEEVQVPCVKMLLNHFAKDRRIANFIDIVVVSVRPETYNALVPNILNSYEGNNFELSSVNVPNVLERRVSALGALLKKQEWTLTTEESVPWTPHGVGLSVRKWGQANAGLESMVLPAGHEGVQSGGAVPDRYTIFRHWGRGDADQLFADIQEYAKGVGLTGVSGVMGVGREEAHKIYEALCGRSVRRALQICERLINSKGVLVSLKRKTKLGAYTFLDAIVSSGLEGSAQGNLVNVFDLESVLGCDGHEFIVPYALHAIKNSDGALKKSIIPREHCVSEMRRLGFKDSLISVLLLFLTRSRLLRTIVGDPSLFHRSDYTWEAHRMLCFEISYLDNVAQRASWLGAPRKQTNGYEVGMIFQRYQNTYEFIRRLRQVEMSWLNSLQVETRINLIGSGLPCVSVQSAISFCDRLAGLQKFDQLDASILSSLAFLYSRCVREFEGVGPYIEAMIGQPQSQSFNDFRMVFNAIG
jgi:hypothetical protein